MSNRMRTVRDDHESVFVDASGQRWRPKGAGGYGPRRSSHFTVGEAVRVSGAPTTTIKVSKVGQPGIYEWWEPVERARPGRRT